MIPTRLTPVTAAIRLHAGKRHITDGVLTILPRRNSTVHPLTGFLYIGEEAHPVRGEIAGLSFEINPPRRTGRTAMTSSNLAIFIAYEAIRMTASHANGVLRDSKVKKFARQQIRELWRRGRGSVRPVEDDRQLRRLIQMGREAIIGAGALRLGAFSGHAEDCSDFVAWVPMPGSTWTREPPGKESTECGPMWFWRWGDAVATFAEECTVRYTPRP